MNKSFTIFFLSILIPLSSLLAQKHDFVWVTAWLNDLNPNWKGNWVDNQVDFDQIPPSISSGQFQVIVAQGGTTISDSDGNFIFYTNGYQVANKNYELMENGDSMNLTFPDAFYTPVDTFFGSGHNQEVIVLPDPGNPEGYYLVNTSVEEFFPAPFRKGTHLLYSKIDMTQDGGLGAVTEKNQILLDDIIQSNGLTAVRHANGRDWWLLIFKSQSPVYYRLLLTENGFSLAGTGQIDTPVYPEFGTNVFSPDGTKFIMTQHEYINGESWVDILDFDRCSGMLSNHKRMKYSAIEGNFTNRAWGASFSPNSRFLYLLMFTKVVQIDLEDMTLSPEKIVDYDGFSSFGGRKSYFGLSQLGLNGLIYTNTAQSTNYFHVITQPNEPGLGCKMNQHGFQLIGTNEYTMPNYPNYRLGPLEGSACDTLGIERPVFIHAHPYPDEGCLGGEAHFEVTAFGTGLTYQWQISADGGEAWLNLTNGGHFSNVHTEYLMLHDIPAAFDGRLFRCIVAGNVSTDTSRTATLSVIGQVPSAAFSYVQDLDSLFFQNLSSGEQYVEWYYGDGNYAALENPTHLYLKSDTFSATLIATNACGQDTAVQDIAVGLEAIFEADRTHGCAPLEVKFKGKSHYRVFNHQYWMTGGTPSFSAPLRNTTTTYNLPGVYDVTLNVYAPGGEWAQTIKEDYITVLEGINPQADIEAQFSGDTLQLNCAFVQANNYNWYFSNGDSLSGQMTQFVPASTGVYQVILEVSNHCGAAFDTLEFIAGQPQAGFSAVSQTGCVPFSMQFENASNFTADSLRWHFPGGWPETASEENPVVVYTTPGVYDVMLIAYAVSFADTVYQQAFIEVMPDDCPAPEIFIQADGLQISASTNCQDGFSYTWDMGDGTQVASPAADYQYDTAGAYTISLIIGGACGSDTVTTALEIEGVSAASHATARSLPLRFRPNPAGEFTEVLFEDKLKAEGVLQIFNTVSEKVMELPVQKGQRTIRVGLKSLPSGIYFVRLNSDGEVWQAGKLVVE